MWSFYLDGRRVKYGTYKDFIGRQLAKIEFASSGNTMKMLVTQFNLWDRVLTNQEIETFAKMCNQGIGNLLSGLICMINQRKVVTSGLPRANPLPNFCQQQHRRPQTHQPQRFPQGHAYFFTRRRRTWAWETVWKRN